MKTQLEKFREHCALWRYDLEVDENDFFVNATTQRAWNIWAASWQAAIESVFVDLSAIDGVTDDSGRTSFDVVSRYDVDQALDKAGGKYE